jgi:D-hexose-6-phosphate mutarotase
VFPFFGPATLAEHKVFPSHGFARSAKWAYAGTAWETEDSVSLKFGNYTIPQLALTASALRTRVSMDLLVDRAQPKSRHCT